MRITERQLRQIIREELIREATYSDSQIGPSASVSPDSDAGNSKIGRPGDASDNSSVSEVSTVINSSVTGGSQVKSSNVDQSDIRGGSTVTRAKIVGYDIHGTKINSSTIRSEEGEYSPNLGGEGLIAIRQINSSDISDAVVRSSMVYRSKISGGAKIIRSAIEDSKLHGTDTEGAYLKNVTAVVATITSNGLPTTVMNADVQYAEIVDSKILGGTIKCNRASRAYMEKVYMTGTPSITGNPQIIGLTDPEGKTQYAEIAGSAQISGSPKIAGKVSGNARVSGNAEVHGLARVEGNCVVTGTARMISGVFTTGTYDSGTHEGGDGIVATVLGKFGL
jgi:hypothetical protein